MEWGAIPSAWLYVKRVVLGGTSTTYHLPLHECIRLVAQLPGELPAFARKLFEPRTGTPFGQVLYWKQVRSHPLIRRGLH